MKIIISLAAFLTISFSSFGQCPVDDIILTTQAEVDAFPIAWPDCVQLQSQLTISGADITDLTPLEPYVSFYVVIKDNPALTSLSGITGSSNLNIVIDNNDALIDFTGLGNSAFNAIDFVIINNDALLSFIGIETAPGGILDRLVVGNNSQLRSIDGLENYVNWEFQTEIEIYDNPLLENLDGLSGLEVIFDPGDITITNNASLINITGLSNLPGGAIEEIIITDNSSLSNCSIESFCQFLDVNPGTGATISNNDDGCNTRMQVEANCLGCPSNLITLSSQAEVDTYNVNYPGCAQPSNGLQISGADITDLTPLSGITSVTGGITISGNPMLSNLDGLENLQDIINGPFHILDNAVLTEITALSGLSGTLSGESIIIQDNPVLSSLNGLHNIVVPGDDDLIIWNNDALVDLSGLESLEIVDDLLIIDNDALDDLNGLSNFELTGSFWVRDNDALTSLDGLGTGGTIYDIEIENNPLLTNIDGLSGYSDDFGANALIKNNPLLTSIAGLDTYDSFEELIIDNNDQLTDLSGLDNLTNSAVVGSASIQIINNDQLTTISALSNVDPNSPTMVEITNNPNLSTCANVFICDYLENGGNATINNNTTGCDSVPEIITICNATLNQISGQIQFDYNSNDCDPNDFAAHNILVEITDGINDYSTLTDAEGNYSRFLNIDGSFTIRIAAGSLPPLFVSDPVSVNTTFNGFGNEEIIDFCLSATETINDLKIVQLPLNDARPGFEANYQLAYENVGTTLQSDVLTLSFPDDRVSFVSSDPAPDNTSGNQLSWDYSDLQPFESRSILLTFDVFSPPTNESGDILVYIAEILPISGDENETDNTYNLDQEVVNSQDPNDKLVNQGETIFESEVGDYLDYLVRFQNVGTASAINVRVEDELDPNLDWNSFRVLSASHDFETEILNGNMISFFFDDINLPPVTVDPEGSNGFIAFQVRSLESLQVGDVVENNANIFFDFNPPILTNTVQTEVIDNLGINELDLNELVKILPNPVSDRLQILVSVDTVVENSVVYSIFGKQLISTTSLEIDFSKLSSGMYFIQITTDSGKTTRKILKE